LRPRRRRPRGQRARPERCPPHGADQRLARRPSCTGTGLEKQGTARARFKAGSFPEYELERASAAAAPLAWNDALAAAAQAHSRDMAAHRHFGHEGSDATTVAERATRAGHGWRLIGENIAAGQTSASEAVAGWIESPGYGANLMNPAFTKMGAGYGISRAKLPGCVYWTQVFGVGP
jgi:uncharacterized protein YkwD